MRYWWYKLQKVLLVLIIVLHHQPAVNPIVNVTGEVNFAIGYLEVNTHSLKSKHLHSLNQQYGILFKT